MTDILFPWQTFGPPAGPVLGKGDQADVKKPAAPKPLGRRPGWWHPSSKFVPEGQTGAEWLYHQLILTGPAAVLERFKAAAHGPGVIPWRLDYAAIEEDIFNLAVSQPPAQRV